MFESAMASGCGSTANAIFNLLLKVNLVYEFGTCTGTFASANKFS